MRGATCVIVQTHQILHLPRKITVRNVREICWKQMKRHFQCAADPRMIREWSDHDPSMIRPWNRQSATRLATEVTFHAHHEHFVLKNTTFRAPAIIPNFTEYCACHEKWHLHFTKYCACHEKWHSNFTKYCACHAKWLSWSILFTHETLFTMRGVTSVIVQTHQILRLPRKMNLMIDPWHKWNVIYNARSNMRHSPNSPNTAPATKNDRPKSQRNLLKTDETSFPMRGRSDHDPTMIQAWSDHDPSMIRPWNRQSATRLAPEVTFHAHHENFVLKNTTFRAPAIIPNFTEYCACHEKWHLHFTKYCACHEKWHLHFTKYCACHEKWHLHFNKYCAWLDWAVTWLSYDLTELWLDWAVTWLSCDLTELWLDWAVTWLSCDLTELWLDWAVTWAVTWLSCDLTELWLDWTVTWLSCDLTELWLDWAITWLSCDLTELWLDWAVTWLSCDLTELWLDWAVTWLSCDLTELWLGWAVTWLSCDLTELWLDWAVTWLSCDLTELWLDWAVTWVNYYLTKLWLDWAVTWLSYYLTELWLDWAETWLSYYLTELWLDWAVTWLSCDLTELWLDWAVTWLSVTCELWLDWAITLRSCSYIGSFSTKLPLNILIINHITNTIQWPETKMTLVWLEKALFWGTNPARQSSVDLQFTSMLLPSQQLTAKWTNESVNSISITHTFYTRQW